MSEPQKIESYDDLEQAQKTAVDSQLMMDIAVDYKLGRLPDASDDIAEYVKNERGKIVNNWSDPDVMNTQVEAHEQFGIGAKDGNATKLINQFAEGMQSAEGLSNNLTNFSTRLVEKSVKELAPAAPDPMMYQHLKGTPVLEAQEVDVNTKTAQNFPLEKPSEVTKNKGFTIV